MAEVINTNVFDAEKKFVDFAGLDYFWEKAKAYVDGADKVTADKVATLESVVGNDASGLVQKVNLIQGELDGLNGGAGSITTQISNAITALDLPNTYEAKGEAAKAETAAKAYADGLASNYEVAGAAKTAEDNAKAYADGLAGNYDAAGTAAGLNEAMDTRVKVLEAIDHEKLASDASAAAVATVLDGAPESFDTLKEVAAWIANNEHASDVATLVTDVENLKKIDHDAYKAADTALETSLKGYVDGKVDGKFDATGSAAQALTDAKAYADGLANNYDEAGAAATAESNAKSYADGKFQIAGDYEAAGTADAKIAALKLPETYDAKGAAADAQAAAIAQAKLDAADALKSYYTKTEVDNLLSTNSTGDRAYAKQYTDELFGSFKFAANSDIDSLFATEA